MHRWIMVMGPSGAGKSTVAAGTARHLHAALIEGDDYHPPGKPRRHGGGMPAGRRDAPPLASGACRCGAPIGREARNRPCCSALRRSHRDLLRDRTWPLVLGYPYAPRDPILSRMKNRDHFMAPGLLASQLATLEDPGADEDPIWLDTARLLDQVLTEALRQL